MPRLVTGVFYERPEAERAIEALRAQGISPDSIYLEREVAPDGMTGRKGGEVRSLETERRFAGLETGSIIGVALGLLSGVGVGMLSMGILEAQRAVGSTPFQPAIPGNPVVTAIIGAVIGLIVGALIGWIIDNTLNSMGAGPARPMEETLVTVRTDEGSLEQVYAALFNARARHLHVAEGMPG